MSIANIFKIIFEIIIVVNEFLDSYDLVRKAKEEGRDITNEELADLDSKRDELKKRLDEIANKTK